MQITVNADGKNSYRPWSGDGRGAPLPKPDEADRRTRQSPGAALRQMNEVSDQPGRGVFILAGGAALVLLSCGVSPWLAVGLAAGTAALFLRVRAAEEQRRRFHLEYELDADAQERWTLLNHALAELAQTAQLWQITAHADRAGRRQEAGEASLVTRKSAILRQELPRLLTSSLTPYCLHLGPQRWLFFPDRLYVQHQGGYETIQYQHLQLKTNRTRFLEEKGVPRDAQIVSRQRQPAGSPDRRSIAIAQYGVLEVQLLSRSRMMLHVSSVGAADQFAALFQLFQKYRRSDGEMPPQEPPSTECYRRLGLPQTCSKADAARQFRRLVLIHHPDRVSRLAPDGGDQARERANAELQEIVLAYKDLKRLRGW